MTKNREKEQMTYLPAIEIVTGEKPDAAVIWLHGLGADGNDFAPVIPELQLPKDLAIRFVFPHAPSIPVTINGGFVMPAWYDILHMEIDRKVDTEQLILSAKAITDLIDREIDRGIQSNRIVLAGFSQGGAVAYHAGLSFNKPLAGVLAMSTYFATDTIVEVAEANSGLNIAVHHGLYDPVVPEELGRKAVERLEQMGFTPEYTTYPMEHSVCHEQIVDISAWLQKNLR